MKEGLLKNLFKNIDHLDRQTLITLVRRFYNQKEFFGKIIDLIRDGIVIIDQMGYILLANNVAEEMLNLKGVTNLMLWKCVPELVSQINLDRVVEHAVVSEIVLNYPSKRLVKFYSVPFVDGDQSCVACIFSDITQSTHDKAQEIEQEKTDSIVLLSSGIAHEIGNPLNSIGLQLELMNSLLNDGSCDEVKKSIKICKSEVSRLHGIIKNFLQAVRPVKPNFTDANLCELLNFVVKFLSPELVNSGVEVTFNVEGDVPIILGDTDQLKQVFFNVIKNAMEAMTTQKRLKIKLSTTDDDVIVAIQDTGEGIPDVKIRNIFDPFSTSKQNGTGLGMFIVQRILRDHNATISVESKERIGTTITMKFPKKFRAMKRIPQSDL